MNRQIAIMAVMGCLMLCASAASAQNAEKRVGQIDFQSLNLVPEGKTPAVELNITEPLLRLAVSTALGATDTIEENQQMPPEAKQIVAMVDELLKNTNLHMLQLRVFKHDWNSPEVASLRENAQKSVNGLINDGWTPIVRVQDGELVNILMHSDGQNIDGFTLLVVDGGEMVFGNLSADIKPEDLGSALGGVMGQVASGQVNMQALGMFMAQMGQGMAQMQQPSTGDHAADSHDDGHHSDHASTGEAHAN